MKSGRVYLVGAGPGDPKLLTVKGQEVLRGADLVVYDYLVSPRVLRHCPSKTKLVYVGKQARKHTVSQDKINRLLIRGARAGKTVVRLKGGDPFLFGRGGEEALSLAKARIPFEVVPGISSAFAVPAYAGIPLTHRAHASSVAILTGHEDPAKARRWAQWGRAATACDTLVFLMGVKTLPEIVAELIRGGRRRDTPTAVIEWGTRTSQRTIAGTLKTIVGQVRRAAIGSPAILVVGDVVSLRRRLRWFETKPLIGQRILVTRAQEKAGALADRLEDLGAEVEELPAIELASVPSNGLFRATVAEMPKTDWVFFTSPEGIGWASRMLKSHRKDVRWLSGCHVAAIGPKTAAAVEAAGLHVDFVPRSFNQEGMLRGLSPRLLRGKRALILCAQESRDALAKGLRQRGMSVKKVPVYRTMVPQGLRKRVAQVFREPFDLITVTSASCAAHLHQALSQARLGGRFPSQRFASIGPVTSQAIRALGGRVAVEADPSTVEGLIDAIARRRPRRTVSRQRGIRRGAS